MFTVTSRSGAVYSDTLRKYPEFFLPGSYLPSNVAQGKLWKEQCVDMMFHEAGHGLARLDENNLHRLLDYGSFKEETQKLGRHAFGVNAGLHETRALVFSVQLYKGLGLDQTAVVVASENMVIHQNMAVHMGATIAYGARDIKNLPKEQTQVFADERDRILDTWSPVQVVDLWHALCSWLFEQQKRLDISAA